MLSSRGIVSLCLALLATTTVWAEEKNTCSDSWMFIDIHYRLVDGHNDTFSYGLFIGAGSASQNQSIWPSVTFNETRMASHDLCSQEGPSNCDISNFTHGHFGASTSLTWKDTPQYTALDAELPDADVNVTYGQDVLNMFTHFFDPSPATKYVVENHPIAVLSDYTSDQDIFFHSGSLGLGSSSTVIKQLLDQKRIDRNVVSMYLGTAYPRAGGTQNGSVVLGGYDSGRFVGEPHKYPLVTPPSSRASSLKVHVKQLSLVTADGTNIGLVTDDGFDGYVSTNQYPMELPSNIIETLSKALGATPANNAENTLQLSQPFNGNLTITLEDGYEITYPSEWISNVSNITPFVASSNTSNTTSDPLIFGTAFLHHLYTTIDYEENTYFFADAKVYDNYVQPQPLCAGDVPIQMAKPTIGKFYQTGMVGVILGGIIGGAALVFVIFFFVRRRMRYKYSKSMIEKLEDGDSSPAPPKKSSMRHHKSALVGVLRLGRDKKQGSEVGKAKRVSWISPQNSPRKVAEITITKSPPSSDDYEMNSLAQSPNNNNNSTSEVRETVLNIPSTTNNTNAPHRYTQQSMPDTPFTASLFTPATSNPLLGAPPAYSTHDDKDDSDIPLEHRNKQSHTRKLSERMKDQFSLNLDTSVSGTGSLRTKPAPLPIRVGGAPKIKDPAATKKASPRREDFLRKLFPAP